MAFCWLQMKDFCQGLIAIDGKPRIVPDGGGRRTGDSKAMLTRRTDWSNASEGHPSIVMRSADRGPVLPYVSPSSPDELC